MISVTAQMVANVTAVQVQPGGAVAEGDTLLVVESMKMEIPVLSPTAGTVLAVHVRVADVIQEGDTLVVLDPGTEAGPQPGPERGPEGGPEPAVPAT